MTTYIWNDGRLSAGRTPTLWIVHRGTIHTFSGDSICGVVAVTRTAYEKNGKWSNTTFDLALAEGATACNLSAPMHGRVWPENDRFTAYERFCREFGVTVSLDAFDAALGRDFRMARDRMLEGEKALESLDANGSGEAELVEITLGKSCARNPHPDVRVSAPDGRAWVVAHEAASGTEIPGVAQITGRKHHPGMRGGMDTLTFAVAAGVTVAHESYPKDGFDLVPDWALGRNGDGVEPVAEPKQPFGTSLGGLLSAAGVK